MIRGGFRLYMSIPFESVWELQDFKIKSVDFVECCFVFVISRLFKIGLDAGSFYNWGYDDLLGEISVPVGFWLGGYLFRFRSDSIFWLQRRLIEFDALFWLRLTRRFPVLHDNYSWNRLGVARWCSNSSKSSQFSLASMCDYNLSFVDYSDFWGQVWLHIVWPCVMWAFY